MEVAQGSERGEKKVCGQKFRITFYSNGMRIVLFFLLLSGLASAAFRADWNQPFPPHKVAEGVYYVGTNYLASFLVVTPAGNILINPDFEESVPVIAKSVESLGFKMKDIKIILISHAHDDHCAGAAAMKKLTGAELMVMGPDVPTVEDGGKSDFDKTYKQGWTTVKVDKRLRDGEVVELGGVKLVAHLTPGHTKGCTTWTMKAGGKDVVIVGSPNVNPGVILKNNSLYPGIAQDFVKGFAVLESLPCDIFLGAHGAYYGMEEKYARLKAGDKNAFVDPAGYKRFVAEKKAEVLGKFRAAGGL